MLHQNGTPGSSYNAPVACPTALRQAKPALQTAAPSIANHEETPPWNIPCPLPYAIDALAPHYSQETPGVPPRQAPQRLRVVNLNNLQKGTEFESMTLWKTIIKKSSGGIYNNAAQIWNHTFFWNCMAPQRRRRTPPAPWLSHQRQVRQLTPRSRKPSSESPWATSARAGPGW